VKQLSLLMPKTRYGCERTREARDAGVACEFLGCRHNLIAEIGRLPMGEAVEAMMVRIEQELPSCALDVVEMARNQPLPDEAIKALIGGSLSGIEATANGALKKQMLAVRRMGDHETFD